MSVSDSIFKVLSSFLTNTCTFNKSKYIHNEVAFPCLPRMDKAFISCILYLFNSGACVHISPMAIKKIDSLFWKMSTFSKSKTCYCGKDFTFLKPISSNKLHVIQT